VAVLIEDLTRSSPKRILLEEVLVALETAGVTKDRITIVIALGSHRPLTDAELGRTFGEDICRDYRILNHDCQSPDLVRVAELPTGTPVRIHLAAAAADLIVGIGSIVPHPMNGFGGGGKILFPGIANFEAIVDHHCRLTFDPGTRLGALTNNRFQDEVSQVARDAGLSFIVNSVMDSDDQACDVVAGDMADAHAAGVAKCREAMGVRFPEPADMTLTASFPYSEGPQVVKPLIPASLVTRKGGVIVWAVDCPDGLPEPFVAALENFRSGHDGRLKKGISKAFRNQRLVLPGGAIDFNMAIGLLLALLADFTLVMVSTDIGPELAERMGARHARTLEDALALAGEIIPRPSVHVIPAGGVILPVTDFQPSSRKGIG
jgi:nickel-dependent lactate racemase